MTLRISFVIVACVAAVALTACGGNINQANYDKIKAGMSVSDVEAILGKGSEEASSALDTSGMPGGMPGMPNMKTSMKVMAWKSGNNVITASFMNGKLMTKGKAGF